METTNKTLAVIFDMDGVIIDSEPAYHKSDEKLLQDIGITLTQEQRRSMVGLTSLGIWEYIYGNFEPKTNKTKEEMMVFHSKLYYDCLADADKMIIPGVAAWMDSLKNNENILVAIASSSVKENVERVIEKCGLGQYLETYITGSDVNEGKPNPEIFVKAADRMGVDATNCVVIEDSRNGVLAAKAAGMKCAGFISNTASGQYLDKADIIINEFNDINYRSVMDLLIGILNVTRQEKR